jgi:predicted transcriptional regulator
MTKLFAKFTLKTLDLLVLKYIKSNPGCRLYEINSETLRSHHSWGTKHIVERLEEQKRIAVIRYQQGKKVAPKYYAFS